MGKKVFLIDLSYCNGCGNCQLACKDEHAGNDWPPYALAQPEIGQFWLKLDQKTCGSAPKLKINYKPRLCNHCENAPCIAAATGGAVYRREDGLVIIDPEKAKGQKQLADACPYGAIFWNEALSLPQKCTGCAHLLDNGGKMPRCVESCPTEAILFGEEKDLADEIEGATVWKPETGLGPRVYYRNVPGTFIGGTLYDPEKKLIIEGAVCRLSNGGKNWTAVTDSFGDFWFNDLPAGIYELLIQAEGYEYKRIEAIRNRNSVNLGDIPLTRA